MTAFSKEDHQQSVVALHMEKATIYFASCLPHPVP